jgi:hypothetical protein
VVFEILAAVVFKMRGFVDMTVLHVVHIVGYGWDHADAVSQVSSGGDEAGAKHSHSDP